MKKLVLLFLLFFTLVSFNSVESAVSKNLHGYNGTDWIPVAVDASGNLEMNANVSTISWYNVIDIPSGFSDNIDNTGPTVWELGANSMYNSSTDFSLGIGTIPTSNLHVIGNSNITGLTYLGNLETNFINTTHILDGTILATDLISTLDISNYTASTGIDITNHVITNLNPYDTENIVFYNNSLLNNSYAQIDQAEIFTKNVTISEDLIVTGNSYLKDFVFTANASFPDSITTDYIYENSLDSTKINNLTVLKDIRVNGNSYLGTLVFDANGTFPDSVLTDYIFPESTGTTLIDNITILKDIRVLGNSYLGSFTIEDDLVIGSNNFSSTRVGIGTTSLSLGKFEVVSEIANSYPLVIWETGETDGLFLFQNNGATGDAVAYLNKDTESGTAATTIQLHTDGNTYFNGGNVGIGTTSPTHTLNVDGTLNVTGDAFLGSFTLQDDLIIGSNNISSTNVGIGTISPSESFGYLTLPYINLHSSGTTALVISSDNSAQQTLIASDGAGYYFDVAGHATATNNNLIFRTEETNSQYTPTERMRITNSGNVGIGTTNPGKKFEVVVTGDLDGINLSSQGAGIRPRFAFERADATSDSLIGQIQFLNGATSVATIDVGGDGATNNGYIGLATAGTERLHIATGGNVGIGTTSPGTELEVSVSGTANVWLEDTTNSTLKGSLSYIGTADGGVFDLSSNMYLDDAGSNAWHDDGSPAWRIRMDDRTSVDTFSIWRAPAGGATPSVVELFTIDNSGNVGIGTTSPTTNLHVEGSGDIVNFSSSGAADFEFVAAGSVELNLVDTTSTANEQRYRLRNEDSKFYIELVNDADNTILTNPFVTDPNGNVGIGTTNPNLLGYTGTTLTISNNASATQTAVLELQGHADTDANFAAIEFINDDVRNAAIIADRDGADNSAELQFFTNNAGSIGQRAVIDKTGNVGIGTTSPTHLLNLYGGNLNVSRTDSDPVIYLENGKTGGNSWLWFSHDDSNDVPGGMGFWEPGVGYGLVIDNSGNVGIGTTSPSHLLSVVGSNAILINISSDGAEDATTFLFDGSGSSGVGRATIEANAKPGVGSRIHFTQGDATRWLIGAGAASDGSNLEFYDGQGGKIVVIENNTGNVGIGTTTPGSILEISGTTPRVTQQQDATNFHSNIVNANGDVNEVIGSSNTGYGWYTGATAFDGTSATNRMYLSSAGNVGIGTTSPNATLDVSDGDIVISDADVAHGMTSIAGTNVRTLISHFNALAGGTYITGMTDGDYSVGNPLVLRGIHGWGSPSDEAVVIEGGKVNGATWQALAAGEQVFGIKNYQTDLVTILGSGNVGIGTTSPTHSLNVVSTSSTALNLSTSHADSWVVLSMSGSGTGGGIIDATGVVNKLLFRTGGTDAMLIDNSGNVGIGTTSPTARLHIKNATDTADDTNILRLESALTNGGTKAIAWKDTSANDVGRIGLKYDGVDEVDFVIEDLYNGGYQTATQAFIVKGGGNVGIGTTSPTHALNVVGDINATGAIYKNGGTALDYVFEENYDLMSIEQLSKYIEENKHLPNLHSSKYTGGSVEVGILPDLLLEKTEEQALYIIQLNNKLEQQNKELNLQIKQLQTEMNQIKQSKLK